MSAMMRIFRTELALQWREPVSLLFVLGFPALMVAMNGKPAADGSPLNTVLMLALGPLMLGLMVLPTTVVGYRERGMLRRLQLTPLSPLVYLLIQVLVGLLLTTLGVLIAIVMAVALFDLAMPPQPHWLLLGLLLGTLALIAVGALVASVVPSTRVAQVVSVVLAFAMMLALLAPSDDSLLSTIAGFAPSRTMAELMLLAWTGGTFSAALPLIGALLAVTVVCLAIAAFLFRWE